MNTYFSKDLDKLRHRFPGSENIHHNYSQAHQDMFVLSMLNGKRNGTYIEIGGNHPVNINNSYLLETAFDWKGLSFDIVPDLVNQYNSIRKNPCICADATNADYEKIFVEHNIPTQIDYLQVDVEPAQQTLNALFQLPFDKYRFSVITYETDLYAYGPECQEKARDFLLSKGYELVLTNVATEVAYPFEDWYVDPAIIDRSIIDKFKRTDTLPKTSYTCLLNI